MGQPRSCFETETVDSGFHSHSRRGARIDPVFPSVKGVERHILVPALATRAVLALAS
jgi:hypothetical protein